MNMFIMGAFFAVALLALAVALWLAYVEEQETSAKAKELLTTAQITSSSAAPLATERIASIPTQKTLPELLVNPVLQLTEKASPLPSVHEQSVPTVSNSQLYELVHELRALHTQSHEMGDRLHALTLLVEQQLQKFPSYHTYVQEDLAV